MGETVAFEDMIGFVEARLAEAAMLGTGPVKEGGGGWYWQNEAGNKQGLYIPHFFADSADQPGAEGLDMDEVRVLQELTLDEEGVVTGKRYYFDADGLLTVFGIHLEAEQAAREDIATVLNESLGLDMDVIGIPEVTPEDDKRFWDTLFSVI